MDGDQYEEIPEFICDLCRDWRLGGNCEKCRAATEDNKERQ